MPVPDWLYFILAIVGGILGAAIGAVPAFILCGISCIAGTIFFIITGDPSINMIVTWGPLIGPHTAFAGGVAAAAYAARKGKLDSGCNIIKPLSSLKSLSILSAGGLFGFIGFLLSWLFDRVPAMQDVSWVNPIALSITVNGLLTRLVIGKTNLLGKINPNQSIWIPCLDENTLPWHIPPLKLIIISFCTALPAAFLSVRIPEISGIIFGFSAVSLTLLVLGLKIPVLLHIILSVQLVAVSTGSIVWGVVFGIAADLTAAFSVHLFLDRGDTHIDPPALAIAVTHSLYVLFLCLGIFNLNEYWSLPAVILSLAGGYFLLIRLKKN